MHDLGAPASGSRGAPPPAGAPPRHHDLLAVGQPLGEVQTREVGSGSGRRAPFDRVLYPGAVREPVDARLAHRAHDIDDHAAVAAAAGAGDEDAG